jgi:hypothetical protein
MSLIAGLCSLAALQAVDDPDQIAADFVDGRLDPLRFDYGALRFDPDDPAVGFEALSALERAVSMRAIPAEFRVDGARVPPEVAGCVLGAVLHGARLARLAEDKARYDAARIEALARYDAASARLAAELAATEVRVDEMIIRDQFWRAQMQREASYAGLDDLARRHLFEAFGVGMCRADQENYQILQSLLQAPDLFFETIYAREDGWLIVQHMPVSLQEVVLSEMEARPGFPGDEARAQAYAFLSDRVAVAQGELQRYGTQGRCRNGAWVASPTSDEAGLEARRAALGLGPQSQLGERNAAACQALAGP